MTTIEAVTEKTTASRVPAPGVWVLVVVLGSFVLGFGLAAAINGALAVVVGLEFAIGLPAVVLGSIRFARDLKRF